MTTIARRRQHPLTDLLAWLGAGTESDLTWAGATSFIPVEDYVEDEHYVLRAEMPGVDPEKDIELTLRDRLLTIRGERREEDKSKNRREFQYGSFERAIQLPAGTEPKDIAATYRDGVLELRVPWAEARPPESQRIPVQRPE